MDRSLEARHERIRLAMEAAERQLAQPPLPWIGEFKRRVPRKKMLKVLLRCLVHCDVPIDIRMQPWIDAAPLNPTPDGSTEEAYRQLVREERRATLRFHYPVRGATEADLDRAFDAEFPGFGDSPYHWGEWAELACRTKLAALTRMPSIEPSNTDWPVLFPTDRGRLCLVRLDSD